MSNLFRKASLDNISSPGLRFLGQTRTYPTTGGSELAARLIILFIYGNDNILAGNFVFNIIKLRFYTGKHVFIDVVFCI